MSFNKAQAEAISHHNGPMLVLAGPGSGKTHVITNRIEFLIKEHRVRPEEILVITFTKYAANEMRDRFFRNYKSKIPVTFGTFHGIFYGILKWAYNIGSQNILSEEEKYKLIDEIISATNMEEFIDVDMDEEEDFITNISKEISIVKNEGLDIHSYESKECPNATFKMIYEEYEMQRKKHRKIDFDDMIVQCHKLFVTNPKVLQQWQNKFKYILIDEFQDINQMQFDTIKLLGKPNDNIFAVGDDDQSIYRFRGAKPEIMLSFNVVYPTAKMINLDMNYRSTTAIIQASQKVIKQNQTRYNKSVKPIKKDGDVVHVQEVKNPLEEAEYVLNEIHKLNQLGVSNREIAVLFRTNLDARVIAGKMIECGVPFRMKEQLPNIYEHFIAKNIISYIELVQGSRLRKTFLSIMNRPNRYIARDAIVNDREITFESLRTFYVDKEWMQDRIDQFELDLRIMKNMTPFAMIEYLRKKVGYDDFLKEYAEYRKMNIQDLKEVLEEIQENAKTFKNLEEWMDYIQDYSLKLKQQMNRSEGNANAVSFHTMHGSKGLEFSYVFLIECNEGITPSKKAKLVDEIEEERRMFYVAMTRAKEKLTLIYPKQKHGKDLHPSRFVHELFLV